VPAKSSKKRKQTQLLAFEDTDFLMRDEMRAYRLALEFERAELRLRDQGIKSTVVVFGSARANLPRKPEKPAKAAKSKKLGRGSQQVILEHELWYQEARRFGKLVSELGGALSAKAGVRENVIATGGGPGIMEAANRGAADAGAATIGFNIQLPTEQRANRYITPSLSFDFHYFAVRKMHFAMRANALAVFPGGFGTLDELFEILTLKQTHKTKGMPVVLFCRSYWENIINFSALAELGMIAPEDLAQFEIVDTAEEGWEAMLKRGLSISTPLHGA